MSQSTYALDGNGSALAVRLGIEAAFDAIATNNSGSSEPAVKKAFMPWADAGSGLMKQRNSTNTGWITIGPLDTPGFGLGDQVGDYKMSARSSIQNYLRCNAQAVSRLTYSLLFAQIGTTFGAGDGTSTFNLPDAQGRALIFPGEGAGLTLRALGQKAGAEIHSLTASEGPVHSHGVGDPGHGHILSQNPRQVLNQGSNFSQNGSEIANGGPGPQILAQVNFTGIQIASSGGSQPHNNMQPSLVAGYLWIRALP